VSSKVEPVVSFDLSSCSLDLLVTLADVLAFATGLLTMRSSDKETICRVHV